MTRIRSYCVLSSVCFVCRLSVAYVFRFECRRRGDLDITGCTPLPMRRTCSLPSLSIFHPVGYLVVVCHRSARLRCDGGSQLTVG